MSASKRRAASAARATSSTRPGHPSKPPLTIPSVVQLPGGVSLRGVPFEVIGRDGDGRPVAFTISPPGTLLAGRGVWVLFADEDAIRRPGQVGQVDAAATLKSACVALAALRMCTWEAHHDAGVLSTGEHTAVVEAYATIERTLATLIDLERRAEDAKAATKEIKETKE